MYMLGVLLGILCLSWAIAGAGAGLYGEAVIAVLLVFCCVGIFVYDVTSPVETIETEIVTNDYAKYALPIESDKLGLVRYIENNATRWGASAKDRDEYSFLDFVE